MPLINRNFKSIFRPLLLVLAICVLFAACQRSDHKSNQIQGGSNGDSASSSTPAPAKPEETPAIVVFGDSLTAGYGLPPEQNYQTLLQQKLKENGYPYRVINAGVSGDTSAGGVRRIDWALEENVKYLILELGANDALRGQPVAEMKKNLAQIIERAQSRGATVILAGMEAPPNMGEEYTREFREAYRDLAKQYQVTFIPFILDGIGGKPDLNQADGIHPNAEGEKVMTENVWRVLEPMLAKP